MHWDQVAVEGTQDIVYVGFVQEVCPLQLRLIVARALREIKYYQKTESLLIQKLPFSRIVRDIADECVRFGEPLRFTCEAFAALQCITEETMTMVFEMTYTQTYIC